MELLSLILAVLALTVGLLALRRADVVGRQVKERRPSATGDTSSHGAPSGDEQAGGAHAAPVPEDARAGIPETGLLYRDSAAVEGAAETTSGGAGATDGGVMPTGRAGSDPGSEQGRRGMRLLGRGHSDPNAELIHRLDVLEGDLKDRISRVEVVRYDAFEGAGGQLSFSLAMLDDRGNGFILTSIHAPAETRTYVKEIPLRDDPLLPSELSPEEREVLRKASAGMSRRARNGGSDV